MAQKYRWSEAWKQWVPIGRPVIDSLLPAEKVLAAPLPHRCNRPDCIDCWNAGVQYASYLKTKRAERF